ncbi:response regulator [Melittangium boletus]|uniref:response regulator n=1 Tax=Melittangium boletus TaxID=83453 RepID=UPI003DA2607B
MNSGLIVEDRQDAQEWLRAVLIAAFPGIQVDVVASVRGALERLAGRSPAIALVDLGLPDGSGVDVLHALRERHPTTLRIVTTILDGDQHLFPALRAGAQGYVLKDQSRPHLVQMLQGIAEGVPVLSPSIARRLLGFFAPPATEPTHESLTPREVEVLTLLAKGLSIAAAADVLALSRHTVGGYVKDIYRKLGVSTRAEAALEAARRGIVPIGD